MALVRARGASFCAERILAEIGLCLGALDCDSGDQAEAPWELLAGLSQFGITPEFSASTNSIEAALDYVEMGLGIALMAYPPQSLTKDHNVVVLPQEELFGSLYLSIAWQADTNMERSILNYTAATAKRLARQIL